MTTPAEKDAMALAVLDRIGTAPISETERGQVAEARAHLASQIDRMVTSDADPELAYRTAQDALEANRAMHRLSQRCEEAEAKPSQEVGRG